jgi:hypothetical protein
MRRFYVLFPVFMLSNLSPALGRSHQENTTSIREVNMCKVCLIFLCSGFILPILFSCSGLDERSGDGGVGQKGGLGETCSANEDCNSQMCYLGDIFLREERGYCTKGCLDIYDCEADSLNETFCCVERSGSSPFCQRIGKGQICGDQNSACGTDCSGKLDSECRSDQLCYRGTEATYCIKGCGTNDDCAGCHPEVAPGAAMLCEPTGTEMYHCLIIF